MNFNHAVNRYRFTVNEQIQLKKLLSRWQLVNGKNSLEWVIDSAKDGKDLLKLLSQHLNESEFYL